MPRSHTRNPGKSTITRPRTTPQTKSGTSQVGPIFLVLAAVYAVGILAAILLPAGTLSDRLETGPVESQPAPSRTEPALA